MYNRDPMFNTHNDHVRAHTIQTTIVYFSVLLDPPIYGISLVRISLRFLKFPENLFLSFEDANEVETLLSPR